MSNVPPVEPNLDDEVVSFVARDGWELEGVLRCPAGVTMTRAAVLVHGSHHERDAFVYGRSLSDELATRGIASLRFDHRGRGASRRPRSWRELAPFERRSVADDIGAAVALVCDRAEVAPDQLAIVAEQDAVRAAVVAMVGAGRGGALVALSPRLGHVELDPLADVPVCALVSKEDRTSLRDAAAAYLAGAGDRSELHVLAGLGFGTTMFMARAFQHPEEPSLETIVAEWIARVLPAIRQPVPGDRSK